MRLGDQLEGFSQVVVCFGQRSPLSVDAADFLHVSNVPWPVLLNHGSKLSFNANL